MTKIVILLIFILDFVGLNGQNPAEHWMKYETPEQAGFSSEKLKSVDSLYVKNGASALMVIYNGNVLISKGDIIRKYDCHSIRKTLISGLYGVYVSNGSIDIHKSLGQIGVDEPIKLTETEKTATIQDLLKSRSGVYIPAFGEDKSMKDSRPQRGSYKPNEFFYYNNWDFNVLGAIFERETHLSLFNSFDKSIAQPLKMEDFKTNDLRFWIDSTESTIYPKYDIKMSARDLARFGLLYCNGGKWNNEQIISPQWISDSYNSYSKIDHKNYKEGYGYMWWVETIDDSITMYSGRGWGGHTVTVLPKANLVLVKRHDTYNTSGGDGWSGMYIRQIIRAKISAQEKNPKLVPFEIEEPQSDNYIVLSNEQLKKYEQKIFLNGRDRTIQLTSNGLLYDNWFILNAVTETKFFINDYNKYLYFKFVNNMPIFDKIE